MSPPLPHYHCRTHYSPSTTIVSGEETRSNQADIEPGLLTLLLQLLWLLPRVISVYMNCSSARQGESEAGRVLSGSCIILTWPCLMAAIGNITTPSLSLHHTSRQAGRQADWHLLVLVTNKLRQFSSGQHCKGFKERDSIW